jgi:hypothetical protein
MTPARFPSVSQLRALRDAIGGLVALADEIREIGEPWTVEDLGAIGSKVADVNAEHAAIRRGRDALKPKPAGARGWPIEVDRALKTIEATMRRLAQSWALDREITVKTMWSDGIGDHPAPVLEGVDRAALLGAMAMLRRVLREVDQAAHEESPPPRETRHSGATMVRSVRSG